MSQNELILDYLQSGHTLTALEALDKFACFRLASRITDLKKMGYAIESRVVTLSNKKRIAEYYLNNNIESEVDRYCLVWFFCGQALTNIKK